jgi:hypothetical protein
VLLQVAVGSTIKSTIPHRTEEDQTQGESSPTFVMYYSWLFGRQSAIKAPFVEVSLQILWTLVIRGHKNISDWLWQPKVGCNSPVE